MKIKFFKYILFCVSALLLSCSSDAFDTDDTSADEQVVFGARLNEMKSTRAPKLVTDKSMNLTFVSNAGYEKGRVDFNSQGIGFSVRFDADDSPLDLIWSYVSPNIYNTDIYSFFLDNLAEEYTDSDPDNSTVVLLPEDNRYKIGLFVEEKDENPDEGIFSNDLIWGAIENVERKKIEDIYLDHVMARFALQVYFDNSAVGEQMFPESASMTNIFHEPVSFDRLTGTLGLPENPVEDPFTLVDNSTGWEQDFDELTRMTYYTSPDFVVPPQEFVANARPRLRVTLTNGRTFTGIFPPVMNIVDSDGAETLWTMAFLKGYKVTLNVKISNEAATLEFMPVSVTDWWDVGTKNLTGIQASLVKDTDFDDLIKAYNAGDDTEFYKYGYKDTETGAWVFNIFRNFTIDANTYKGRMTENSSMPYRFNIMNTIMTISIGTNEINISGDEGNSILKQLLSEGIVPKVN